MELDLATSNPTEAATLASDFCNCPSKGRSPHFRRDDVEQDYDHQKKGRHPEAPVNRRCVYDKGSEQKTYTDGADSAP